MVNNNPNGSEETIDSLLEKGLYFFGADKVPEAIRVWEQVLAICPGEPRATDYLTSAGVDVPVSTRSTVQGLQPDVLFPADAPGSSPVAPSKEAENRPKLRVVPSQNRGDVEIPNITPLVSPPVHTRTNDPLRQRQPSAAPPPPEEKRKLWPILLGALILVGIAIVFVWSRQSKTEDGNQVASANQSAEEAVVVVARSPTKVDKSLSDPDSSGSLTDTDTDTDTNTPTETDPPAKALLPEADPAAKESLTEPSDNFYVVELQVLPTFAKIEIDGVEVGTGGLVQRLERDGKLHKLFIEAPGFMPQTLSFVDAPPPSQIRLRARKTARVKTRRPEKVVKQQPPKVVVEPLPKVKPPQPPPKPKPPKVKPKPKPEPEPDTPRRTDNRDPWQ